MPAHSFLYNNLTIIHFVLHFSIQSLSARSEYSECLHCLENDKKKAAGISGKSCSAAHNKHVEG